MTRPLWCFTGALCACFLFCNFQCGEPECEYPVLLHSWQSSWLDNSGAEPLPAAGQVPRQALGIRLAAFMSSDGQDTLRVAPAEPCYYFLFPLINRLEIRATEAFDTVAAGSSINDRFRVRVVQGPHLRYQPLNAAFPEVNSLDPDDNSLYHIDLLMIAPPEQPGSYRFSVRIGFDSLSTLPHPDTFFTLPPIVLQ